MKFIAQAFMPGFEMNGCQTLALAGIAFDNPSKSAEDPL
jgi:hypothetical protein